MKILLNILHLTPFKIENLNLRGGVEARNTLSSHVIDDAMNWGGVGVHSKGDK